MRSPDAWSDPFEVHGHWWNVEQPDNKVSGVLSKSDSGELQLDTAGGWIISGSEDSALLLGDAQGEAWTLSDCFYTGSSSTGQKIQVNVVLRGVRLDSHGLNQLDEIRVGFDGVWHAVDRRPRASPTRLTEAPIHVSGELPGGWSLEMDSELLSTESPDGTYSTRDRLLFRARTDTPSDLHNLRFHALEPLRALVAFALQHSAVMTFCDISGPGTDTPFGSRVRRERAVAYWESPRAPSTEVARRGPAAVAIPTDPHAFQHLMRNWFELHDLLQIPISIRLTNLDASIPYAEPCFLLTAQALEAVHRRLHPDEIDVDAAAAIAAAIDSVSAQHLRILEQRLQHADQPTLRRRLKQLVDEVRDPMESVIDRSRLKIAIAKIVELRNNVTHWDPGTDAADGLTFSALQQVGEAIFDLVIVHRLCLPDPAMQRVVNAHSAKNIDYVLSRALADGPSK